MLDQWAHAVALLYIAHLEAQLAAPSALCLPQAAAINAQQLARSPEGLPLLLSLLEPEPSGLADFYARYHALQVLKGLVAAAPLALQQVGAGWGAVGGRPE